MSATRALIFDCDGVLADTERDGHLVAFNQAFAQLGLPFRWSAEEYAGLLKIGGGKERLAAYLAAHPEFDLGAEGQVLDVIAAVHKLKSQLYVDLVEGGALPARPGVRRLITEALDAGWQVAVASTSASRSVAAVLGSVIGAENTERVSGVFAGDIVSAKKPAPDIYLLALHELGRSTDEAVVVEDSEAGAAAAARAGLRHIVTLSHFTTNDPFPHASAVVSDLGDYDAPARLVSGQDIRNSQGVVDLSGIEALLPQPNEALAAR